MDPQNDLPDLVEDLEVNIDELTATLTPLLGTQLSTTASSLPLLDKAKLYVLAVYTIESLLYSTLQASGVDAKEHAIFKELARLKGYFGKIKSIEERTSTSAAPKPKLDVGAAARFIKHGLAGNDRYDLERAERQAKERARAQLKARQINKKFDDNGAEESTTPAKKRDIADVVATAPEGDTNDDVMTGLEEASAPSPTEPAPKKPKLAAGQTGSAQRSKRSKNRPKSAETSDAEINAHLSQSQSQSQSQDSTAPPPRPRSTRKKSGKTPSKPRSPAQLDVPENNATTVHTTPTATQRKTRRSDAAATEIQAGGDGDGDDDGNGSAQHMPDREADKPKRGRGRPKKGK